MSQLSGKMIESKPLYVAIAQRKEDRRVRLQVCFSWNHLVLWYTYYSYFACWSFNSKQLDPSCTSLRMSHCV